MSRILAVSLFALVCSPGMHAQAVVGSGAITGIVKDKYGDGIPETTIVLVNKLTGFKRITQTSDFGIFDMPALPPRSSYSLKVTRNGYADWEIPSFDLSLGETLSFNITLYTDKAATPADAQRSLAAVQGSKTSLSTVINDDQLFALPVVAFQPETLVLLAPAVVNNPAGALAFRGAVSRNVFLLDGVSITNNYYLNQPGIAPFVMRESLSEMQVVSAVAPAGFAHTMGGFVNAVTKTGTNSLHGTAYDYYDPNGWNAHDFFGNGFAPIGRLNHAGASLGLPVSTNTLFLFGNIERINTSSQGLNRIPNPLLTEPGGNTALISGCTATAVQCSAAATFINQQLNVKVPQSQISTNGFARMDYLPGERDNFMLAGAILSQRAVNSLDNATVAANGGLLGSNATVTDSTRHATTAWTHVINDAMVNELHGDWLRDTLTAATDPALLPASSAGCLACGTGPLAINVAGTPLGGNPAVPFNLREQRYGGADSLTLTVAAHTLRAGIDIWQTQDAMNQLYARFGMYNYASLSSFAKDFSANFLATKNYATFEQTLGTPTTNLTSTLFSGYAEDTWKALPGLTVDAGIRWEKWRLPQPAQPNPTNFLSASIPSPNTDFSPRIGVAYLIDNRTVVRAGGGWYYEPLPGQLVRDLWTGGGIYQSYYELTPADVGSPVFPKVLPGSATATLNPALLGQFFAASKFRNPYTIQAIAGVERRLNRYVSLAATYVQSRGLRAWTATDLNLIGNTNTAETYSVTNAQGAVVNSYTTQVWNAATAGPHFQISNEGAAQYRGATAQVRTAALAGLSVQASYTLSHAQDDLSGPPILNSVVPSNYAPGDFAGDYGRSAFDQRNRVVVNFIWQPVVNHKTDILSSFLLNGWLVSGIATYGSSMSVTPTVEVQGQQFAGLKMDFTTSLNGTGGWSRVPFEPVNVLPLGSSSSVDLRLSRSLPFTARLKGQLTLEALNAFNHENVSAVNTIAYTAVSGVVTPVIGLGAPIASYGYPFGTSARRVQAAFRLEF